MKHKSISRESLLKTIENLTEENARLEDSVANARRRAWINDFRPIINAIGEISVQEAMDAIERAL
jgi:hypothetical protein